MNYHIFLGMGLRSRASWSSAISLLIIQTSIGNSIICSDIWHKYHERYFKIVMRNFTKRWTSEIRDNSEISRVVFMPNIRYKSCYYYLGVAQIE